jgi:hypothetical protein
MTFIKKEVYDQSFRLLCKMALGLVLETLLRQWLFLGIAVGQMLSQAAVCSPPGVLLRRE